MKLVWSIILLCSSILAMEEYAKISLLEAIMGDPKFITHEKFYEFRDFIDSKNSRYFVYKTHAHQFFQEILDSSVPMQNTSAECERFVLDNKDQILNKTLSDEKKSQLLQLKLSEILETDAFKGKGEFKKRLKALQNSDKEEIARTYCIFAHRRAIAQLFSCCIS